MTKTVHFQTVLGSQVDEENMIVKGVSVITEGVARGHNMMVDRECLEQIKALAEEFDGGLKVKMDHYTGFDAIVGRLKNFRIKGKKLLADLCLIKTHEAASRIMEMADEMPDTFGLSVSFSGDPEEKDGFNWARASELYSADLVDEPAANPDGLFSANPETAPSDTTQTNRTPQAMSNSNPKQGGEPKNPTLAELQTQLSTLAGTVQTLVEAMPKPERKIDDGTSLSDCSIGDLRGLIQTEVASQATALGWKPGQAKPGEGEKGGEGGGTSNQPSDGTQFQAGDKKPNPEEEKKTFPDIVKGLVEGGMSKAEAVTFALKKPENHEAFTAWKASGGSAHFNF